MKILHTVEYYHPHIGGSEEVVRQISERLVKRGHSVTVATSDLPTRDLFTLNGVKIIPFAISGNIARGFSGKDQARYQDLVMNGDFDLVMNYAAQNWTTDLVLPILANISASKVIVPCGYSGLNNPMYAQYFTQLPTYLRLYDRIIYMSPNYQDKKFGDQHNINNYSIIPNGADEDEFSKPTLGFREQFGITTKYVLICVANFYRAKGQDIVIDAFARMERQDVSLVLIGNPVQDRHRLLQRYYLSIRLKSKVNRNIHILEDLPREWVISAYKEADLFVFGSRIECSPLVIQEAMAAGLPFISTRCGDIPDYEPYGAIVENADEMASQIKFFLDRADLRDQIGRQAKENWSEKHTWQKISDQYEKLYLSLVEGKQPVS